MAIEIALRCERHPEYVPKKARPRCKGCQELYNAAGLTISLAANQNRSVRVRARVYRVEVDPQ